MRFTLEPGSGPLADALAGIAESTGNPGTILQVTGASAQATVAVGMADLQAQEPMRADHLMQIGSITKTVTAVVILQLAEEGLIDLDAPASTYLDPAMSEGIANIDKATVRDLLMLRSGIPHSTDPDNDGDEAKEIAAIEATPDIVYTSVDLLDAVRNLPALAEPGTAYDYSNTNFALLGEMIREVTGKPLEEVYHQRVFEPAGMNETSFMTLPPPEGQASGYMVRHGVLTDMTRFNVLLGAEGGLVGPADDVTRFMRALFEDRILLNEESLAAMISGKPMDPSGEGPHYGFGLTVDTLPGIGPLYLHTGTTLAFDSVVMHAPEIDTTVLYLGNSALGDDTLYGQMVFGSLNQVLGDFGQTWAAVNDWLF